MSTSLLPEECQWIMSAVAEHMVGSTNAVIGADLSQKACSIVLDLIVAQVQLKQALIAVLLERSADLCCSSIPQLIASQVNLAQGSVEHEQVSQGTGPLLSPHLAPPQPQLLHLLTTPEFGIPTAH